MHYNLIYPKLVKHLALRARSWWPISAIERVPTIDRVSVHADPIRESPDLLDALVAGVTLAAQRLQLAAPERDQIPIVGHDMVDLPRDLELTTSQAAFAQRRDGQLVTRTPAPPLGVVQRIDRAMCSRSSGHDLEKTRCTVARVDLRQTLSAT